ncbi:hypothetical protein [Shinella sp. DD12]|uniref:hypothetical protein n=1 Tax=Shinella sp. DD12 TaxID=1410620 RepID=UPI000437C2CF|nr:hypothetical protein [Shinella sp. DD12]EYR81816.1 hypothetical protein SHLA_4c001070 [Shinella sp. DD12]
MAWPPADGSPFRPANGTEGCIFESRYCEHCSRDAAFRQDMENNDGCEILAAAHAGEQPTQWVYRGGMGHCTNFSDDPANPIRCLTTMEMF